MTARVPVLVGLLAALLLCASPRLAEAQRAQCNVLSIVASSSGASIEPALEPYRAQLMRAPLNAFTSFTLSGTQRLTLERGSAGQLSLGQNIAGELRYESSSGGLLRLHLILRRQGQTLINTRLAASPGHPFFVAGPIVPGGTLVLGIVCR